MSRRVARVPCRWARPFGGDKHNVAQEDRAVAFYVAVRGFRAGRDVCRGAVRLWRGRSPNRDFAVGFDQNVDSNFSFPDYSRFDTARFDGPIVGEGGGEAIDDGGDDGGDDQLVDVISFRLAAVAPRAVPGFHATLQHQPFR